MNMRLDDQLRVIRMSGEKPNFAELARIYDCDYRTVLENTNYDEIIRIHPKKNLCKLK